MSADSPSKVCSARVWPPLTITSTFVLPAVSVGSLMETSILTDSWSSRIEPMALPFSEYRMERSLSSVA